MEGLFEFLESAEQRKGLRSIVIDAHALSFYGVARETADLDLLVSRNQVETWKEVLSEEDYTIYHAGENFLQYHPPVSIAWPLDLMIVPDRTFDRMYADSQIVRLHGKAVRVPSLKHLLALKLHALKHTHSRRTIKDFQDVVQLVQENAIDLGQDATREWFVRYGTEEWYEKVRRACD